MAQIGQSDIESRRLAREIVCEYGWWTLQWPIVKRNFPRTARWSVNAAVTLAVARGFVKSLRI